MNGGRERKGAETKQRKGENKESTNMHLGKENQGRERIEQKRNEGRDRMKSEGKEYQKEYRV